MEVVKPVQMVLVEYVCDQCEEGKMVQKGHPDTWDTPWKYPHQCENCGYLEFINEPPYPRTEWRELETE